MTMIRGARVCKNCFKVKPIEEFKSNYRVCRECKRENHLPYIHITPVKGV